jgi:hypothetical protein
MMRDEFVSYSFLAATILGIVLLCAGLLAAVLA